VNKQTLKEELKNIGFVFGSCIIITTIVFTTMIGCGVAKDAVKVESGAAQAEIKDNSIEVNPELIAALNAEINKVIAEKIDNITNNSGAFSGGAPYLLAVILALISLIQWIFGRSTKMRLYETKEQVKKQHEMIKELAVRIKKERDDAEYKAQISAIRGKYEK